MTCVVRGPMICRSGYPPKLLGVLLPAFVGELALCLWLLLRGVDLPRWRQRVEAARRATA